ncbi:MAG: ARMT1-like domain-containing protein [candidate division Zixibacteria bacterium]|nr:ARMT1-like domain-containing protein [candidate division Zixibacteria bacterium]
MRSYLECIPCFFDQALRAGKIATGDEKLLKRILDELGAMLSQVSLESTPPETGRLVYRIVREITGNADPYRKLKIESTQHALALYPSLKRTIEKSNDSLLTAIRIAIAGNVIDFGASDSFDIDAAIKETLDKDFAVCDYSAFKRYLTTAKRILYIGDNAGETVFDRLLIEQLKKPVVYVVRETPVINDATTEDAVLAGIDRVARIVSSGTDAPGTILSICSPEFIQLLDGYEFVIAKGQGNYEGLSNDNRQLFFLLKTKCQIIADDIGVIKGDIVLKGINTST